MYLTNFYYDKKVINHKVTKITDNVNDIIDNSIFVAIKGYTYNGLDFVNDAITKGAKTIIYDQDLKLDNSNINLIKVLDSKVELARLLKKFYKKRKHSKMIAVTGTNGKTSTTNYLYQILKKNNYNLLLIGTGYVYKYFKNNEYTLKTNNTTLKLTSIYELIYENTYDYVIMEASSQGIEEGRLLGLEFDIVSFTNITQDHLDYHLTMDNYVNSKAKIIYSIKQKGNLILNYNMAYFNYLKKLSLVDIKTYSLYNNVANFYLEKINSNSYYIIDNINNKKIKIHTNLIGSFNLENLLASYVIYNLLNLNIDKFIKHISSIKHVKGRMNLYKLKDFYVLVDFAHTPDGVFRVLEDIRKLNYKKIITIIGCGGNKDKEKRPIIGNFATKYSDYVIFTEDNSRNELIEDIIQDMVKEIKTDNYEIIYNRPDAINKALSIAGENEIILILGKGSEEYIIKDEIIKHSDLDYIEEKGAIRING